MSSKSPFLKIVALATVFTFCFTNTIAYSDASSISLAFQSSVETSHLKTVALAQSKAALDELLGKRPLETETPKPGIIPRSVFKQTLRDQQAKEQKSPRQLVKKSSDDLSKLRPTSTTGMNKTRAELRLSFVRRFMVFAMSGAFAIGSTLFATMSNLWAQDPEDFFDPISPMGIMNPLNLWNMHNPLSLWYYDWRTSETGASQAFVGKESVKFWLGRDGQTRIKIISAFALLGEEPNKDEKFSIDRFFEKVLKDETESNENRFLVALYMAAAGQGDLRKYAKDMLLKTMNDPKLSGDDRFWAAMFYVKSAFSNEGSYKDQASAENLLVQVLHDETQPIEKRLAAALFYAQHRSDEWKTAAFAENLLVKTLYDETKNLTIRFEAALFYALNSSGRMKTANDAEGLFVRTLYDESKPLADRLIVASFYVVNESGRWKTAKYARDLIAQALGDERKPLWERLIALTIVVATENLRGSDTQKKAIALARLAFEGKTEIQPVSTSVPATQSANLSTQLAAPISLRGLRGELTPDEIIVQSAVEKLLRSGRGSKDRGDALLNLLGRSDIARPLLEQALQERRAAGKPEDDREVELLKSALGLVRSELRAVMDVVEVLKSNIPVLILGLCALACFTAYFVMRRRTVEPIVLRMKNEINSADIRIPRRNLRQVVRRLTARLKDPKQIEESIQFTIEVVKRLHADAVQQGPEVYGDFDWSRTNLGDLAAAARKIVGEGNDYQFVFENPMRYPIPPRNYYARVVVRSRSELRKMSSAAIEAETAMGRVVAEKLRTPLSAGGDAEVAKKLLQGGYGQPGYGVATGAAIDGSHAFDGNQGYYIQHAGGEDIDLEAFMDSVRALYRFFLRRAERNGKPIRYVIKIGIGGQHTPFQGIADVFQVVDPSAGVVVGEYELGKNFEDSIKTTLRRLNASWDEVAVIPSSKSGSTDETMLIFVKIFNKFLKSIAEEKMGFPPDMSAALADVVMRTLHDINFINGVERPNADLFKIDKQRFGTDSLITLVYQQAREIYRFDMSREEIEEIFRLVLGNMFFETTDRPADSRLSAFIRNSGLDRELAANATHPYDDAPGFGSMFDNVGGRWTGDIHMMAFLAFHDLDAKAYWQARKNGIKEVRKGKHLGNRLGNKILDEGITDIALLVPDELFWFGKAMEQNWNESIWQDGFANLVAVRKSDWEAQKHHYEHKPERLVINLSNQLLPNGSFHQVDIKAGLLVPSKIWSLDKQHASILFADLFTTFYGMTNTAGTRLIARALEKAGHSLKDLKNVDLANLDNPVTQIIQENLFLRQPYVELGKKLLEERLKKLQERQAEANENALDPFVIEKAFDEIREDSQKQHIASNVPQLVLPADGFNYVKLVRTILLAKRYAESTGRKFVPILYLEGEKFTSLRDFLISLGVEWVMQGTGDQHISYQQVLAQPQKFLPFIISFVPELGKEDPGLPAIGFAKGYLDKISPHMARDYFAEASYQALVGKRKDAGGEGLFMRLPDTQFEIEKLKKAFQYAFRLSDPSTGARATSRAELRSVEAAWVLSLIIGLAGGLVTSIIAFRLLRRDEKQRQATSNPSSIGVSRNARSELRQNRPGSGEPDLRPLGAKSELRIKVFPWNKEMTVVDMALIVGLLAVIAISIGSFISRVVVDRSLDPAATPPAIQPAASESSPKSRSELRSRDLDLKGRSVRAVVTIGRGMPSRVYPSPVEDDSEAGKVVNQKILQEAVEFLREKSLSYQAKNLDPNPEMASLFEELHEQLGQTALREIAAKLRSGSLSPKKDHNLIINALKILDNSRSELRQDRNRPSGSTVRDPSSRSGLLGMTEAKPTNLSGVRVGDQISVGDGSASITLTVIDIRSQAERSRRLGFSRKPSKPGVRFSFPKPVPSGVSLGGFERNGGWLFWEKENDVPTEIVVGGFPYPQRAYFFITGINPVNAEVHIQVMAPAALTVRKEVPISASPQSSSRDESGAGSSDRAAKSELRSARPSTRLELRTGAQNPVGSGAARPKLREPLSASAAPMSELRGGNPSRRGTLPHEQWEFRPGASNSYKIGFSTVSFLTGFAEVQRETFFGLSEISFVWEVNHSLRSGYRLVIWKTADGKAVVHTSLPEPVDGAIVFDWDVSQSSLQLPTVLQISISEIEAGAEFPLEKARISVKKLRRTASETVTPERGATARIPPSQAPPVDRWQEENMGSVPALPAAAEPPAKPETLPASAGPTKSANSVSTLSLNPPSAKSELRATVAPTAKKEIAHRADGVVVVAGKADEQSRRAVTIEVGKKAVTLLPSEHSILEFAAALEELGFSNVAVADEGLKIGDTIIAEPWDVRHHGAFVKALGENKPPDTGGRIETRRSELRLDFVTEVLVRLMEVSPLTLVAGAAVVALVSGTITFFIRRHLSSKRAEQTEGFLREWIFHIGTYEMNPDDRNAFISAGEKLIDFVNLLGRHGYPILEAVWAIKDDNERKDFIMALYRPMLGSGFFKHPEKVVKARVRGINNVLEAVRKFRKEEIAGFKVTFKKLWRARRGTLPSLRGYEFVVREVSLPAARPTRTAVNTRSELRLKTNVFNPSPGSRNLMVSARRLELEVPSSAGRSELRAQVHAEAVSGGHVRVWFDGENPVTVETAAELARFFTDHGHKTINTGLGRLVVSWNGERIPIQWGQTVADQINTKLRSELRTGGLQNPSDALGSFVKSRQLSPIDAIYYLALLADYFETGGKGKKLKIGENFTPSAQLEPNQLLDQLGLVQYEDLATKASSTDLSKTTLQINIMDGGLGTNVKRDRYLTRTLQKPERTPIGAKGTDLHFNVMLEGKDVSGKTIQKTISASIAEIKFLRALLMADTFGHVVYRPMVSDEKGESSKAAYDAFWDEIFLLDRIDDSIPPEQKRTYRQIADLKDIAIDELIQRFFPNLSKSGGLTEERIAPGNHGQLGFHILLSILDHRYDKNYRGIQVFANGDNLSAMIDEVIARWMIDENVPMVMISTDKAPIDKKGGQIGIEIMEDGGMRTQILEVRQAQNAGQQELFYDMGLRAEDGKQAFNTNVFAFNEKLLHDIMQDLVGVLGKDELIRRMSPDLIVNEKEKNGKKYLQLEGAIASVVLNLNAIFETDKRPEIQDILKKHGVQKLLRIVNVSGDRRSQFFTPVKSAFDFWLQAFSKGYYKLDTAAWRLKDQASGLLPPEVDLDPLYDDVQNLIDALGDANVRQLKSLMIKGAVKLGMPARLEGDVSIVNWYPHPVNLADYEVLDKMKTGAREMTLKDIGILILPTGHIQLMEPQALRDLYYTWEFLTAAAKQLEKIEERLGQEPYLIQKSSFSADASGRAARRAILLARNESEAGFKILKTILQDEILHGKFPPSKQLEEIAQKIEEVSKGLNDVPMDPNLGISRVREEIESEFGRTIKLIRAAASLSDRNSTAPRSELRLRATVQPPVLPHYGDKPRNSGAWKAIAYGFASPIFVAAGVALAVVSFAPHAVMALFGLIHLHIFQGGKKERLRDWALAADDLAWATSLGAQISPQESAGSTKSKLTWAGQIEKLIRICNRFWRGGASIISEAAGFKDREREKFIKDVLEAFGKAGISEYGPLGSKEIKGIKEVALLFKEAFRSGTSDAFEIRLKPIHVTIALGVAQVDYYKFEAREKNESPALSKSSLATRRSELRLPAGELLSFSNHPFLGGMLAFIRFFTWLVREIALAWGLVRWYFDWRTRLHFAGRAALIDRDEPAKEEIRWQQAQEIMRYAKRLWRGGRTIIKAANTLDIDEFKAFLQVVYDAFLNAPFQKKGPIQSRQIRRIKDVVRAIQKLRSGTFEVRIRAVRDVRSVTPERVIYYEFFIRVPQEKATGALRQWLASYASKDDGPKKILNNLAFRRDLTRASIGMNSEFPVAITFDQLNAAIGELNSEAGFPFKIVKETEITDSRSRIFEFSVGSKPGSGLLRSELRFGHVSSFPATARASAKSELRQNPVDSGRSTSDRPDPKSELRSTDLETIPALISVGILAILYLIARAWVPESGRLVSFRRASLTSLFSSTTSFLLLKHWDVLHSGLYAVVIGLCFGVGSRVLFLREERSLGNARQGKNKGENLRSELRSATFSPFYVDQGETRRQFSFYPPTYSQPDTPQSANGRSELRNLEADQGVGQSKRSSVLSEAKPSRRAELRSGGVAQKTLPARVADHNNGVAPQEVEDEEGLGRLLHEEPEDFMTKERAIAAANRQLERRTITSTITRAFPKLPKRYKRVKDSFYESGDQELWLFFDFSENGWKLHEASPSERESGPLFEMEYDRTAGVLQVKRVFDRKTKQFQIKVKKDPLRDVAKDTKTDTLLLVLSRSAVEKLRKRHFHFFGTDRETNVYKHHVISDSAWRLRLNRARAELRDLSFESRVSSFELPVPLGLKGLAMDYGLSTMDSSSRAELRSARPSTRLELRTGAQSPLGSGAARPKLREPLSASAAPMSELRQNRPGSGEPGLRQLSRVDSTITPAQEQSVPVHSAPLGAMSELRGIRTDFPVLLMTPTGFADIATIAPEELLVLSVLNDVAGNDVNNKGTIAAVLANAYLLESEEFRETAGTILSATASFGEQPPLARLLAAFALGDAQEQTIDDIAKDPAQPPLARALAAFYMVNRYRVQSLGEYFNALDQILSEKMEAFEYVLVASIALQSVDMNRRDRISSRLMAIMENEKQEPFARALAASALIRFKGFSPKRPAISVLESIMENENPKNSFARVWAAIFLTLSANEKVGTFQELARMMDDDPAPLIRLLAAIGLYNNNRALHYYGKDSKLIQKALDVISKIPAIADSYFSQHGEEGSGSLVSTLAMLTVAQDARQSGEVRSGALEALLDEAGISRSELRSARPSTRLELRTGAQSPLGSGAARPKLREPLSASAASMSELRQNRPGSGEPDLRQLSRVDSTITPAQEQSVPVHSEPLGAMSELRSKHQASNKTLLASVDNAESSAHPEVTFTPEEYEIVKKQLLPLLNGIVLMERGYDAYQSFMADHMERGSGGRIELDQGGVFSKIWRVHQIIFSWKYGRDAAEHFSTAIPQASDLLVLHRLLRTLEQMNPAARTKLRPVTKKAVPPPKPGSPRRARKGNGGGNGGSKAKAVIFDDIRSLVRSAINLKSGSKVPEETLVQIAGFLAVLSADPAKQSSVRSDLITFLTDCEQAIGDLGDVVWGEFNFGQLLVRANWNFDCICWRAKPGNQGKYVLELDRSELRQPSVIESSSGGGTKQSQSEIASTPPESSSRNDGHFRSELRLNLAQGVERGTVSFDTLNSRASYREETLKTLLGEARSYAEEVADDETPIDAAALGRILGMDLTSPAPQAELLAAREAKLLLPHLVRKLWGTLPKVAKAVAGRYVLVAMVSTEAEKMAIDEMNRALAAQNLPQDWQIRVIHVKPGKTGFVKHAIGDLKRNERIGFFSAIGLQEDTGWANEFLWKNGFLGEPFKPIASIDQFLGALGLAGKLVLERANSLLTAIAA